MVSVTGCDDGGPRDTSSDGGESTNATPAKTSRTKTDKSKDRGSAVMTIGDRAWESSYASARLKDGKLRISASRSSTMPDGKRQRESLTLVLSDFDGPGEYDVGMSSSFVGVGINVDAMKKAETDEQVTKQAIGMLSGAKVVLLMGMKVKITSVTDTQVEGSFEFIPPKGARKPALRNGKIRAVLKK